MRKWKISNAQWYAARDCGYARIGIFRLRSGRHGMPQGIVVMREWEDLGCAAYQNHV